MDDLEVECPLWNMRFPHLERLNLLDWNAEFPPSQRQYAKDFIAYHSKNLTIYGFTFGLFRTRTEVVFAAKVQGSDNRWLRLYSVNGSTDLLRDLADSHVDRIKESLKFLSLKSAPNLSFSGNESQLGNFDELITDLVDKYMDAGRLFSLTIIEIKEDAVAEDITGLKRQFRKLCGPVLTIWKGCTPPETVIEAEKLANAFSVFPVLQDLNIDEYVLGKEENPEESVLTLASRLLTYIGYSLGPFMSTTIVPIGYTAKSLISVFLGMAAMVLYLSSNVEFTSRSMNNLAIILLPTSCILRLLNVVRFDLCEPCLL
jgi:hypothetical protein